MISGLAERILYNDYEELIKVVDKMIAVTNEEYVPGFIDQVLTEEFIEETVLQNFATRITAEVLDRCNMYTASLGASVAEQCAREQIKLEKSQAEEEKKSSDTLWYAKMPPGTTLQDFYNMDLQTRRRTIKVGTYTTLIAAVRNDRVEIMELFNKRKKETMESIREQMESESKRLKRLYYNKINEIAQVRCLGMTLPNRILLSRALDKVSRRYIRLYTLEEIVDDIFSKIRCVNDEEVKLNNNMLFYQNIGLCNYMIESAFETQFLRQAMAHNALVDADINKLNRKFFPYMGRRYGLPLPSNFDGSTPPGPGSVGRRTVEESRGNTEHEAEIRKEIQREMAERVPTSPRLGNGPSNNWSDIQYNGPMLDLDDKSLRSNMLPTLERLTNTLYNMNLVQQN